MSLDKFKCFYQSIINNMAVIDTSIHTSVDIYTWLLFLLLQRNRCGCIILLNLAKTSWCGHCAAGLVVSGLHNTHTCHRFHSWSDCNNHNDIIWQKLNKHRVTPHKFYQCLFEYPTLDKKLKQDFVKNTTNFFNKKIFRLFMQ